ncbi:MAG: hypothetical protein QG640_55 [Patescibacteria group bacterium]|nr:hypothetical protein [Patescibacteria group bacterium]
MKKTLIKILPILLILMTIGVVLVPHVTQAAAVTTLLEGASTSFINNILAGIANMFLGLTSTLVIVSGIFLSVSVNLTTHIGDFFDSIPALKDVWIVVRNISSMFIIFALIYASIRTILGDGTGNLKKLVLNVIMVGLLINFSLFFTKIAIDASNLVSLQFYRAIAPDTAENFSTGKVFTDGGLSNVFMSSLKIPQIYQNKGVLAGVDVGAGIFFAAVGGMIMMLTAAISFFAAAVMFTLRTGVLLFIMALSPLYFASFIFPHKDLQGKASELKNLFVSQLVFMPAYLFLMYLSLRLISSPGFSSIFNQSATGVATAGEGAFGPTFIGVIIQFIIALFFINAPLVFAQKMGGMGAGWAPKVGAVSGWFKKGAQNSAGSTWRNTGGRVASRVAQSETMQRFAGSSFAGEQLRRGMLGVARGYDENLGRRIADREATYNSLNDSRARTNYSGRLTNSIFTRSGQISMATTGRADRVGAARILTRRQTEITAEINRLVSRERQLQAIIAGNPGNNIPPRALTQVEQAELDAINGTPGNPGDLATENANLATIQRQIQQFQLNTGGSQVPGPVPPGRVGPPRPVVSGGSTPRQVNRRNY